TMPSAPGLRLRAVGPGDLENLRAWKNANVAGFFFRGVITPAMQAEWYEAYRARPDDFMFIVEKDGIQAGCMGFRIRNSGEADTYNMIAAPEAKGRGIMKAAMILMCSYIAQTRTKDIGCLVVKGNPAVSYYEHCGYRVTGDGGDHHVLSLDWSVFKPIPVEERSELA
ncbi:MAG: GNAT family N-acetyltransferase, partial [Elusimicrobiota bacterium]